MQVSLASCPSRHALRVVPPQQSPRPLRFARADGSAHLRPGEEWQRHYRRAAAALGEAQARAERAEQRLQSRLAELAWPAALGGITAGLAAVLTMRLAGF